MIYFIHDKQSGAVKIGYAADPQKRLAELQTGCPNGLELIRTLHGQRREEKEVHRRLKRFRHRGEWFAANAGPLNAAIAEMRRLAAEEREMRRRGIWGRLMAWLTRA